MMRNEAYARQLERQWRGLRRDINKLADTYELTELQGGNQGGGGGGGWIPPGGGGQTSTLRTGLRELSIRRQVSGS
jgi:hypothetical protein